MYKWQSDLIACDYSTTAYVEPRQERVLVLANIGYLTL